MNRQTRPFAPLKLLTLSAVLALSACSTIRPDPLQRPALKEATTADAKTARAGVEPINGELTLAEAVSRAFKYNLERRVKMMEEALAFNQFEAGKFDMLPKLVAMAGYSWRNNDKINLSRNTETGALSPSQFVSSDREHEMHGVEFTWSLLDLSLGYYGSRQNADRLLIAGERRVKAMEQLAMDVSTAFWRASAAQQLRTKVASTVRVAEEALKDARAAEGQRVRNPLDSMRYQRQLLENLRLLEAIKSELATAEIELAHLINAPLNERIVLANQQPRDLARFLLGLAPEKLEAAALANNPDLREAHYHSRIAREEVRRTMARLFPNLSVNWAVRYDSDSYLVNRDWQEAGVQLSFNLFNLFTGPTQVKLAEAGVALADQRRVTMQMGVMAQLQLARVGLADAREQFERADNIWEIDRRIVEMVSSRTDAQAASKLDLVASATSETLSVLRRYQALAQVHKAESRMITTLGIPPAVSSVDDLTLKQIEVQLLRQSADLERFFE